MGRGRLKMELIENERARKTTFQKRRKGMMKKAYEFSTLCELDMCMIVYGPKLTDRPPELHTWPENREEVNRIINKYKASTMCKPAKKTFDLNDLLMDRKTKVHVDIDRARKEMYETKYPTWDDRLDSFSENQLEVLLNTLKDQLESGKRTLLHRKRKQSTDHRHQQVVVMEKGAPKKLLLLGESSNQKQPCNYYIQDHHEEDQKPMSSLNNNMVDMLSFDHHHPHHHHHHPHHHPCDHQMRQFENSDQYLNNLMAPNPGPMAMWMLTESNYNYNYSTLHQLSAAGGSSSNSQYLPVEGYTSNFSDQMTMLNNNNISYIVPPSSSTSMSQYYARLLQPDVPYMQMQYPTMVPPSSTISSHQVQVHASQVKENHDHGFDDDVINQYLVMNSKMV